MCVKLSLAHSKCSIYATYYISVNTGLTTETEPPQNQLSLHRLLSNAAPPPPTLHPPPHSSLLN